MDWDDEAVGHLANITEFVIMGGQRQECTASDATWNLAGILEDFVAEFIARGIVDLMENRDFAIEQDLKLKAAVEEWKIQTKLQESEEE